MLRQASASRVAKLYLRASVQTNMIPAGYTLDVPDLKHWWNDVYYANVIAFAKMPLNQHALNSLSSFLEMTPSILTMNQQLQSGWMALEHKLNEFYDAHKQLPNDGSKEAQAQAIRVSKAFYAALTMVQDSHKKCDMLFNSNKDVLSQLTHENLWGAFSQIPVVAESLLAYEKCCKMALLHTQSFFVEIEESIKDEMTRASARQQNQGQGGIGGFFNKLFRRASDSIQGQLNKIVDSMEVTLDALLLDKLDPKVLQEAIQSYKAMSICADTHYHVASLFTNPHSDFHPMYGDFAYNTRTKEKVNLQPLFLFLQSNSEGFQGNTNRSKVIEGKRILLTHQHAQKMVSIISHIIK